MTRKALFIILVISILALSLSACNDGDVYNTLDDAAEQVSKAANALDNATDGNHGGCVSYEAAESLGLATNPCDNE